MKRHISDDFAHGSSKINLGSIRFLQVTGKYKQNHLTISQRLIKPYCKKGDALPRFNGSGDKKWIHN
jgi:hypothetical protein